MRLIKILRLLLHILIGALLTLVLAGILRLSSTNPFFRRLKKWWLSRICHLLAIEITLYGAPVKDTVLFVANHISWLDIPLLASIVNPNFLSKAEVRAWPFIGWMAEKAGTLFIHRGNRSSALSITTKMTNKLSNDTDIKNVSESILFFPEGTTSNGMDLLRFRPRLFVAAIEAEVSAQPILVRYPDTKHSYNPVIPFIGQQTLFDNLWKILGEQKIVAEVHFMDPVSSVNKTNKELASSCETILRGKLTIL